MSLPHDGIFATPIEPLFNNKYLSVSSEMLQDWLISIAKQNILHIKASKETKHIFSTGDWCQCIFFVCEKFDLPWQARFAALDILDRFLLKHVQDLYKHVQNSESMNKKSDWSEILTRISKQAFLRIVTCCQIASKLNSHYKVVTIKRVRRCLLEAGYQYSYDSILQSEMRVLKTLGYQVVLATSVDFVELLLEILGRNCEEESDNIKAYHEQAVKVLTLVHMHQEPIYARLYHSVARISHGRLPEPDSPEHVKKLSAIKADKMLLAVSVIAAAAHIIDQTHTSAMITNLHRISEVPPEDIDDFVRVVLWHIKGDLVTGGGQEQDMDIFGQVAN